MNKYPWEEKSIRELVAQANQLLKTSDMMNEEEETEDDAEGGYFEEDQVKYSYKQIELLLLLMEKLEIPGRLQKR